MESGSLAVYISLELLIAVLAVLGNVLVCWAVSLNSNLQSITNYFVVSLAVADVAVGLLAIPFAITISIGFCSNFHGCLFIACFVLVLTQSSIFSLLAIAIDRYIAITVPLRVWNEFWSSLWVHSNTVVVIGTLVGVLLVPSGWIGHLRYNSVVTSSRAKCLIAVCWILSVVIGLTPMLGWNSHATNTTNSSCPVGMSECLFEKVVTMDYMVYFNFFACVLTPLLAMLVIYARIFMVARHQLRQIERKTSYGHLHTDGSSSTRTTLQREIHAAKSLSIIVGLFALCWLPVHIHNCFTLFCPSCPRPPAWIMYLAIILSHANSALNPFIYAYRLREFRSTFRRIIRQHVLCRRTRLDSSSAATGGPARISVVESSMETVAENGKVQNSEGPDLSSDVVVVKDCYVTTHVNLGPLSSSRTTHTVEITMVS